MPEINVTMPTKIWRRFLMLVTTMLEMNVTMSEINIVETIPATNGTIVRKGENAFLSCRTDISWFFCLWHSPFGDKQCAIQENGATNVCKGDPRLSLSAGVRNCDLNIENATTSDHGAWMCLVHDGDNFDTDKAYMSVHIGMEAEVNLHMQGEKGVKVVRVVEGTQKEIRCEAVGANPRPVFAWAGPGEEGWKVARGEDGRRAAPAMSKYIGVRPGISNISRGNLTIKEEAQHKYNRTGHYFSSFETVTYFANLNDTNKTITCFVRQIDKFGNVVYRVDQSVTVIVDEIYIPVIQSTTLTQTIGIISGVLLAVIFLILVCVILTILACRREKRSPPPSNSEIDADYQIHPIWTTTSSEKQDDRHFRHDESFLGLCNASVSDSDSGGRSVVRTESGGQSVVSVHSYRSALSRLDDEHRPITRATRTSSDGMSNSSYETDRSLGVEDVRMTVAQQHFSRDPGVGLSASNLSLHPRSATSKTNLRSMSSLHETHFGVSRNSSPRTVLHPSAPTSLYPSNFSFHLAGRKLPQNVPGCRKKIYDSSQPSLKRFYSTESVGASHDRLHQDVLRRPASTLGLSLPCHTPIGWVPSISSRLSFATSSSSSRDLGCLVEDELEQLEAAMKKLADGGSDLMEDVESSSKCSSEFSSSIRDGQHTV